MKLNGDIQIQETGTSLNDLLTKTNTNTTDISNLTPTTLFSGETTGNVTLNDDISNYKCVDIIYGKSNSKETRRLYMDNYNQFNLSTTNVWDSGCQSLYFSISISGTTITKGYSGYVMPQGSFVVENQVKIFSVIGYK